MKCEAAVFSPEALEEARAALAEAYARGNGIAAQALSRRIDEYQCLCWRGVGAPEKRAGA